MRIEPLIVRDLNVVPCCQHIAPHPVKDQICPVNLLVIRLLYLNRVFGDYLNVYIVRVYLFLNLAVVYECTYKRLGLLDDSYYSSKLERIYEDLVDFEDAFIYERDFENATFV